MTNRQESAVPDDPRVGPCQCQQCGRRGRPYEFCIDVVGKTEARDGRDWDIGVCPDCGKLSALEALQSAWRKTTAAMLRRAAK